MVKPGASACENRASWMQWRIRVRGDFDGPRDEMGMAGRPGIAQPVAADVSRVFVREAVAEAAIWDMGHRSGEFLSHDLPPKGSFCKDRCPNVGIE